jgi:hypothetical protein
MKVKDFLFFFGIFVLGSFNVPAEAARLLLDDPER